MELLWVVRKEPGKTSLRVSYAEWVRGGSDTCRNRLAFNMLPISTSAPKGIAMRKSRK